MFDNSKTSAKLLKELDQMSDTLTQAETGKTELIPIIDKLQTIVQNITQEIQFNNVAEEMRRRFEFIANNAREFMTLINSEYIYEAANNSYCLAHDKKHDEIINKSVADVWGKSIFNSTIKKYLDQCLSGQEVAYEEWFSFPALGKRYFDVRYYPYYSKDGNVTHVVVITHDITQRKTAEDNLNTHRNHLEELVKTRTFDLEKSNQQLQAEILERKRLEEKQASLIHDLKIALNNVKRLQGLLPICANCKKVRDDKGYWEEVDAYFIEHSDVEFTHGICPDCAKKLYSEFYDDKE